MGKNKTKCRFLFAWIHNKIKKIKIEPKLLIEIFKFVCTSGGLWKLLTIEITSKKTEDNLFFNFSRNYILIHFEIKKKYTETLKEIAVTHSILKTTSIERREKN